MILSHNSLTQYSRTIPFILLSHDTLTQNHHTQYYYTILSHTNPAQYSHIIFSILIRNTLIKQLIVSRAPWYNLGGLTVFDGLSPHIGFSLLHMLKVLTVVPCLREFWLAVDKGYTALPWLHTSVKLALSSR